MFAEKTSLTNHISLFYINHIHLYKRKVTIITVRLYKKTFTQEKFFFIYTRSLKRTTIYSHCCLMKLYNCSCRNLILLVLSKCIILMLHTWKRRDKQLVNVSWEQIFEVHHHGVKKEFPSNTTKREKRVYCHMFL